MDCDLEIASNKLDDFLRTPATTGLGQKHSQAGYIFLAPNEVVDRFIRAHPQYQNVHPKLLEHLEKTRHIENRTIAVPRGSALAASM
jgi:hypothetical protein